MKVSDLFISNPIASIQDTDLMYLSVDDGGGGWDSGACTFLSLKNNIPTLYTADGTLLADRTIDMDGNIALWEGGQVAIGAPGTAFDDVLAMLQVFPNGERPAFAIGSFAGVQAQAGVIALAANDFIAGYAEGADITDTANIRFALVREGLAAEYSMYFYGEDGVTQPKILMGTGDTFSRLKLYDDLNQSFLEFFADGKIFLGGVNKNVDIFGDEITIGDTAEKIAFLGAAPIVKQVSGAVLTNSVTSGGTDNTIDNWTDLTTYATDAAAIRNAVYQLARKLKQINDGLRDFGLFT